MRKTFGLSLKPKALLFSGSPPAGGQEAVTLQSRKMFAVYALYNNVTRKIYIGQTSNLQKRLEQHNKKYGNHFTSKSQGKWELIYQESAATRSEAIVREKQLKSYRGRLFIKSLIPG